MLRRIILLVSGVVVLILCTSCAFIQDQQKIAKAKQMTEQYFGQVAAGDSHADAQLGLTGAHVFGRIQWLNDPSVVRPPELPAVFNSTITFWVQATQDGQAVNLSRTTKLTILENADDAKWQIQSVEFTDKPLTLLDQVSQWLLWCFLGPLFLFIYVFGLSNSNAGCATVVTRWAILPWVGYVSFVCFSSILAIVIGLVVYTILILFVLGILNSLVASVSNYRAAY